MTFRSITQSPGQEQKTKSSSPIFNESGVLIENFVSENRVSYFSFHKLSKKDTVNVLSIIADATRESNKDMKVSDTAIPQQVEPQYSFLETANRNLEIVLVNISGEEYEQCQKASENMWSSKKGGQWGRGLLNSSSDKYRAERIGRLGEMAFAKTFNLPVDFTYRELGDERDFEKNGLKIDVKTSSKVPSYLSGLIRAETDRGKTIPLDCDIYFFACLMTEDVENKFAQVGLIGYDYKDQIVSRKMVPARYGNHRNYELPYKELKTTRDLKKVLI